MLYRKRTLSGFSAHHQFLWVAILGVMLLLLPTGVRAISPTSGGGRIRVADAPIGNYVVTAVTTPDPLTPGAAQLTIAVGEGAEQTRVRDARVEILVSPINGSQPPQHYVTDHETAGNAFDYGAHIELPTTGVWDFRILVEGPGGQGETNFRVDVQDPINLGVMLACAVPFVMGGILIGWLILTRHMVAEPEGGA